MYPAGQSGIWIATGLITFWVALGSWVAVFPGTLERLFGIDYSFKDSWGVSAVKYEVLTIGTLVVIFVVGVAGYLSGASVRSHSVVVPIQTEGDRRRTRLIARRRWTDGADSGRVGCPRSTASSNDHC